VQTVKAAVLVAELMVRTFLIRLRDQELLVKDLPVETLVDQKILVVHPQEAAARGRQVSVLSGLDGDQEKAQAATGFSPLLTAQQLTAQAEAQVPMVILMFMQMVD
jgi:hypothetical protein